MSSESTNSNRYTSIIETAKILNCGIISGLSQAAVFNPWDRALYLSVKNERPFLDRQNFLRPWDGLMQTIVQRALSSGLYFPLEELYHSIVVYFFKDYGMLLPYSTLCAGSLAGATNGLIMNPSAAVKVSLCTLGIRNFSI